MRKIIHCDFDCFYAAIEERDNPDLKGLPIGVGGASNKRGVIATCNYEARKYGVHSAMSSAQALRRCPDLVLVKPNMKKYRAVSQQAHHIYQQYSQIIEPLSLDEAFLDVSENKQFQGSATLIANQLCTDIRDQLLITASCGVAPNKFLAKIASDWNKPDGVFVITPEDVSHFMTELPVGKIFGVGKVTETKMKKQNIYTCGDLQKYKEEELKKKFGKFGKGLYRLCRGIDDRPVNTNRIRKSISVEHTYSKDRENFEQCMIEIPTLLDELTTRIEKSEKDWEINSFVIKVKYSDFSQTTAEKSLTELSKKMTYSNLDKRSPELISLLESLLQTALSRKPLPVRLLGLGAKVQTATTQEDLSQLSLWTEE